MPCFREECKTSALFQGPHPASRCLQYGPTRTASNGKLPENKASISTSWAKATVLLQRNYKLSLIPKLTTESQEGTFSSSSSLSETIFLDRRQCHCHQRPPSHFLDISLELRVWYAAIKHSGAHQQKEGRRPEPPSSTGISAYACRLDQVTTSVTLLVWYGPVRVLTRAEVAVGCLG